MLAIRGAPLKCYFVPPGKPSHHHHDDSGPGIETLPQALLDRHGARVLHPTAVPVAYDWDAPRSTVYRARTLLVPPRLLQKPFLGGINTVLERVGMRLVPVSAPKELAGDPGLAEVPAIAVLVPARGRGRVPVVVDAWNAHRAPRRGCQRQGRRRPGKRRPGRRPRGWPA